jgi:hypothetical protein
MKSPPITSFPYTSEDQGVDMNIAVFTTHYGLELRRCRLTG